MDELSEKLFAKPRATEEELQVKLAELTDFVENAALPLHWVDGEGFITWANQAELDSLGYTKEEYIGHPINKFHADEEIINDILSRLIGNETLHNYSARLKCKDGSIKHVLINSNVLWQEGKFVHTRCFTRDITEIVKEQERKAVLLTQLEESEQRLRMAIESTKLGTWDYNPLTGEFSLSKECEKIYGLVDGAPVTFELFSAQVDPQDMTYVSEQLSRALDPLGEGNYDISYRILRLNDNSVRWIKAQGKVYFNSDKKAERFISTVVDITESKIADERNANLAAIIESSDDAIISKALDGIVTSWNRSAQRMFGYTEEEMIGQPIFKLIPKDLLEEEQTILARLNNGEHVEHFETRRITKAGKVIDVSLTMSPVRDSQGKIIGLSKITRDITEKKQEEQRKNDFIGMVSHELKTPLTSLSALIQVSNSKLKNADDPFLASAMDKAALQVKKMSNMINGFLNVSRFESGRIAIDRQYFDLHQLLEEIIEDTQLTVTTHAIRVSPCETVRVFADRDKIGSVISNLLSNAIKYSPKGKVIAVKCKVHEYDLQVSIKDEGMGIKEHDMEKLFDRYYRIQTNHTRNISGFGIGLYLCAEIIKQHHGKIWVDSESGVGSTFHFSLPVATEHAGL
jgi:two-component system sensor histidine kinase VicK